MYIFKNLTLFSGYRYIYVAIKPKNNIILVYLYEYYIIFFYIKSFMEASWYNSNKIQSASCHVLAYVCN